MDDLAINDAVTIPGWELWFTASRAGGPGGQHVNKTASRVTLHWNLRGTTVLDDAQRARVERKLATYVNLEGVLAMSVDSERSQHRNLDLAREKLAESVRAALVRPRRRVATKPTHGARLRRLDEKRKRAGLKKLRQEPPKAE